MKKQDQLKGKVVVITGASSGAGRATALEVAKQGGSVVLAARREEVLNEVAEECRLLGGDALVVPTDVTDAGQMNTLAAMAQHWGGKIDAWVNNAGILAAGAFDETPISVHEKIIETNLIGYIHGAHAVLPHFKAQGYGIVINNISVGGWFPTPYASSYSASKFGLRGFGESLQGELLHYPNIHVCNLYPAFLDTPGIQHAANFTGKVLRPAPPIYNPQRIAKAMAHLITHPKNQTSVTATSTLLRVAHAIFPGISRRVTANVIEIYLRNADKTPYTTGNVFEPVEFGTSIHGGWEIKPKTKAALFGAAIVATGLAIGISVLKMRK
ncbi:MAG: SDR family oxidoreductase [Chitinophagaceae bacterium]|nr:MAG: SDR family oxidoreductase [Chitinophagaceae bacterium]